MINQVGIFRKSALTVAVALSITGEAYAADSELVINTQNRIVESRSWSNGFGTLLATNGSGLYLEVWQGDDEILYGQYSQLGNVIGAAFPLAVPETSPSQLALAMNANGDAVFIWSGAAMISNVRQGGLFAQSIPANSTAVTPSPMVLSTTDYYWLSASMDSLGGFNVTAADMGGVVKHFNASGALVASFDFAEGSCTTPVSALMGGMHFHLKSAGAPGHMTKACMPSLATNADGVSVVAWDQGGHIYARKFDNAGAPLDSYPQQIDVTPQAVINGKTGIPKTEYFPVDPAVAIDDEGDFIVAWERVKVGSSTQFKKTRVCYSYYYTDYCYTRRDAIVRSAMGSSIVAQRFIAGLPVNINQGLPADKVLLRSGNKRNGYMKIDSDGTGNFALAWTQWFADPAQLNHFGSVSNGEIIVKSNVMARKFASTMKPDGPGYVLEKASKAKPGSNDYSSAFVPHVALDDQGSMEVSWDLESRTMENGGGASSVSSVRFVPGKGVK